MAQRRFIVRVDDKDDDELAFFGWQCVAKGDEFSSYERPYDGERQIISNIAPRYMVLDDYNDATQLSNGAIILGPGTRH